MLGAKLYQDSAMIKEFDNLMRSDSTMKVSLTPDRLKTMEVYKQEKDGRGNRRPPPLAFPDTSSGRANGRRPSLRHVDSIVEDEEEPTSNTSSSVPPNKSSRSNPNPPLPMSQARRGPTGPAGFDSDPFPVKTRRIQKNRESLDLNAVMAGSDDEDADEQPAPPRTPSRNPAPPTTPRRQPSTPRLASSCPRGLDCS
ncbi:hypothetical protein FB45DRAFT_425823 [Roridomyces roridus]|uniref:Uncharacterized protein n=1 Tax=Roridomyces roridus TaxID=1738132 RepID=A0AAD7C5G2_9AGAR|nr:hypothetical protein FB45DRAFT_425823 [Roridomyces roridus]